MNCKIAALILLLGALLHIAAQPAWSLTISVVPIGNLGNANDPRDGSSTIAGTQNYGGVNYPYSMGTTEVTVGQYTEFLNAIADTDTYSAYNPDIDRDPRTGRITRTGSPGNYSYSVVGSPNLPITWITFGNAARFVNWLHNGQPTGSQTATTTEDGAYTLNGAIFPVDYRHVTRNSGAIWVIPNENEWYKAAYHKNDGVTGNYWSFPTRFDTEPYSDQPPGIDSPSPSNTANTFEIDFLANGYNDGYATIGSPANIDVLYLTQVGAYTSAPGPYGTYDQAGNVAEYIDALPSSNTRMVRGGMYPYDGNFSRFSSSLEMERNNAVGFRVATLGHQAAVTVVNTPTTTPVGGGSGTVGGAVVGLTATSEGSFLQTYTNYNVNQLPPLPAFAPGNFLLSVPGSTLQYWDLHFSGTFTGAATVSFTFNQSLIPSGATMGIWHFDEGTGWEFLGGTIQGNTITVATDSFSPFAMAAAPVPALPGDYNGNGSVDVADYVLWRKNNNTAFTLPNDATPGTSPADYAVWRSHFGQTPGSGSSAGANTAVPEPATFLLLVFGMAGWRPWRRRAV